MSYKYNGSMIQIAHPVQSISVNKQRVIFSDTQGLKNAMFQTARDARVCVKWLKANYSVRAINWLRSYCYYTVPAL